MNIDYQSADEAPAPFLVEVLATVAKGARLLVPVYDDLLLPSPPPPPSSVRYGVFEKLQRSYVRA